MKTIIKIMVVIACLLGTVLSCQKDKATKAEVDKNVHNEQSTPNEQDDQFRIVLRESFHDDMCVIKLNNEELLSYEVTTFVHGVAYVLNIDYAEGEQELYVNINGIERTYLFEYKKGHSICIDYDPASSTISFHYYTYIWKPGFEG